MYEALARSITYDWDVLVVNRLSPSKAIIETSTVRFEQGLQVQGETQKGGKFDAVPYDS